jgi:hypothetical protein
LEILAYVAYLLVVGVLSLRVNRRAAQLAEAGA